MTIAYFNTNTAKPPVSAELQEELSNHALVISGSVPNWLSGTLVRNGPIKVTIDGQSNAHWFDGLAMLHAFAFHDGKVNYTNKFLRTDPYKTVFDEGSLNYTGFAVDPCRSLFSKFFTFFFPSSHPAIQNANVNVAKLADAYVALTEIPLPVKFDPQTLDTLGVLNYQDALPKEECWESAHPHYDSKRKSMLNYLIKFGRNSYYTLYEVEDGFPERKIIAEVPVEDPSYMHSFAVTENYIVLTEYPFVVKPLDLILGRKAFIKNFTWQPERGTRFIIVDRKNGNVNGIYATRPFFAFHHANAFEKDNKIFLDIVTYQDAKIITGEMFKTEKTLSYHYPSHLERFVLSLDSGKINSEVLLAKGNEFPRMNELFDGKHYQYVYLTGATSNAEETDGSVAGEKLYKLNTATKESLEWSERGCSAGEPVFVAAPEAKSEDDGVVLAVVIDHKQLSSFLLILDGKSFKELGRARAPHFIPAGLHSQFFK